MPIEAVKIPQNVNVEDRIVGPITLRQLIILLVTGGISYALWTAAKTQLGVASIPVTIICWIPAFIGLAFAFVKIQGISLLRLLLLMAEGTQKPSKRMWGPRQGIAINFSFYTPSQEPAKTVAREPHHDKLEELSALLDRGPLSNEDAISETPSIEASTHPVDPSRFAVSTSPAGQLVDDLAPIGSTKRSNPDPSMESNNQGFMDILPSSPTHT
ncbi:MAG: PrgI family protein [Candidatus Peregrinibacteria bacterium]